MSSPERELLTKLSQGIERGRCLLDRLLSLARAQSILGSPNAHVSVQDVFCRVLAVLM